MKKFYSISWNVDSTPAHLGCSILFSIYIMAFINVFIGSMGGIPAFTGFVVVYYLLRAMILAGNRISHMLAIESKTEIKYLFFNYGIFYMLIWLVMKVVIFISKMSGWGNINGLTYQEYFHNIYGSTMLERWAYFFAGILMFAFVISLFPLVVIRKRRNWFRYIIFDSAFFAIVCFAIAYISRIFIDNELESKAVCVLDDLLLCELPKQWQAAMYIVAIILFTLVVCVVSFKIALKEYGPQKGTKEVDEKLLDAGYERSKAYVLVLGIVAIVIVVAVGGFFFLPSRSKEKYKKVAECLTDDEVFGPMCYDDKIYIPVDVELDFDETGKPLGYLGYKDQSCDSRFYSLAISNILYKSKDKNSKYLQMSGADTNSYLKASTVEKQDLWKNDEVFMLWDEDWVSESSYSKEITGYSQCEKALVESLEEQFGQVKYDAKAFEDYDAYFTICGYDDMKDVLSVDKPRGDWVGCILVKDNMFYYGNYDNRITGINLQRLLKVLGGN